MRTHAQPPLHADPETSAFISVGAPNGPIWRSWEARSELQGFPLMPHSGRCPGAYSYVALHIRSKLDAAMIIDATLRHFVIRANRTLNRRGRELSQQRGFERTDDPILDALRGA